MRAGAQARADAFARDLDREVTRVFLRLPLDQEALDRRDFTRFAERYDAWRARAERPDLVADVFLVEWPDAGARVSRYAPEKRTFEPAAWPERLGATLIASGRGRPGVDKRSRRAGPIAFASDGTPVLTVPVLPGSAVELARDPQSGRSLRTERGARGRARRVRHPGRAAAGAGRAPLRRRGRPRVQPGDRARGRARRARLVLDRCDAGPGGRRRRGGPARAAAGGGERRRRAGPARPAHGGAGRGRCLRCGAGPRSPGLDVHAPRRCGRRAARVAASGSGPASGACRRRIARARSTRWSPRRAAGT